MWLSLIPFALLGILTATWRESQEDGCIVFAPKWFVREKVLDFDFVAELQNSGIGASLDTLRLTHANIPETSLMLGEAQPGQKLMLTNSTGGTRHARVVANTPTEFVYREDLWWRQRITHNLSFTDFDPAMTESGVIPAGSTVFIYKRTWNGALVLLLLRTVYPAITDWIGHGFLPPGVPRGLTDARIIIQRSWEGEEDIVVAPSMSIVRKKGANKELVSSPDRGEPGDWQGTELGFGGE